jgi:hypothetical protein
MLKRWHAGLFRLFIISICMSGSTPAYVAAEDFLDRLMERCSKGDEKACSELDKLTEKYRKQVDRLNAQADAFLAISASLDIERGDKPNIKKAYPIILERYMSSDTVDPVHTKMGLKHELVNICADHLHDLYFIHGKQIPRLKSGKPDWGIIYLVIIEHYFRFCSKQCVIR